jgi:hypothetical protein
MSLFNQFKALSPSQQTKVIELTPEVTERDLAERYDSMLDDCHEPYRLGQLEYSASEVLKAVDPVAYRCGFADFTGDDDSFVEIDGHYFEARALEEAIEAVTADFEWSCFYDFLSPEQQSKVDALSQDEHDQLVITAKLDFDGDYLDLVAKVFPEGEAK